MFSTANILMGSAELFVDGKSVGYTRGGLRLRTNKSLWFRPSILSLGVVEGVKTSEEYYINTVLLENTLAQLKKAWGIDGEITSPDGTTSYQKMEFGGRQRPLPVHNLKFISNAQSTLAVFYKVVSMDFGEVNLVKNSESFIPVTFRVLLDETKSPGAQVGYILRGLNWGAGDLQARVTVVGPIRRNSNVVCRVKVY